MKRRALFLSVLLLSLFSPLAVVFADETKKEQPLPFYVQPVLPENQLDSSVGYFYLPSTPNNRQEVAISIENRSKKKQVYQVDVLPGATNKNGVLSFTTVGFQAKQPNISTLVKPKQDKVTIPAGKKKRVTLVVDSPKKSFSGILLGGVKVSQAPSRSKEKKGMRVKNNLDYMIGFVLAGDEKSPLYSIEKPKLVEVSAKSRGKHNFVKVVFEHPYPFIMENVVFQSSIYDQKKNKLVSKKTIEDVKLAPHTLFSPEMDWEYAQLEAGKYRYQGTVKIGNQTWKYKKNFSVSDAQAKKIREDYQTRIAISNRWFVFVGILAIGTLSILILVVWRYYQRIKEGVR
ncbi:DUF916 domain-containing protein [Enterococcus gilvus]|uniref:Uncharacterized protein n=1 Tax=Enterococcus gilvus ATCC BAA-350 TaxID=1158614 RepID=R2XH83_9ENTE|nr:DUF916 domain-containing protein [Enterococcus gilvus]EOI53938.1 hypothetical protein UKC_03891 [Enterococcus gilvus ATCC BAA-350]EOW80787.1 hypothetical protein I592_00071 [Enterococcus gilvus ATCC BAA-350]MBS5821207.1 DUF916 and DUF3324 domain-containing protein [Enterococcus gilvus]OJG41374.1 hypothetical protein RV02_GL000961 [Enterococcus gilvus]